MSGHSKWSKIQHKKGKKDKARSGVFTKLLKAISVAAMSGGDPDMNFSLRLAIEKAKAANVPKDNIERAIKKGTGDLNDGKVIEEVVYEGFGVSGVAFIIEAMTDNRNRTGPEIKSTLSKRGGSLGSQGSVQWQFEHKGIIRFSNEKKKALADWDSFQLELMDVGAEDILEDVDGVGIFSAVENLKKVLDKVAEAGIEPDDSGLEWIPKETMEVSDEIAEKNMNLYELLNELDDVSAVYVNI